MTTAFLIANLLGLLGFWAEPANSPPLTDKGTDSPAKVLTVDLLVVGGTESGCAAAVQAARMGVSSIVLVNDIDWLGGGSSHRKGWSPSMRMTARPVPSRACGIGCRFPAAGCSKK